MTLELPVDVTKLGAYGVILTPRGFVFIEKPGKGRGLELPGGHGELADAHSDPDASLEKLWEESLRNCFSRETMEETGVDVDPEELRFLEGPQFRPTHVIGIFFVQLGRHPKTIKTEIVNGAGQVTEIVHVIPAREVKGMRHRFFPPHLKHIDVALKMLDLGGCKKM